MDAISARLPFAVDADHGPAFLAPDGAGQNFYAIDRGFNIGSARKTRWRRRRSIAKVKRRS
jgi:hypothetical protein